MTLANGFGYYCSVKHIFVVLLLISHFSAEAREFKSEADAKIILKQVFGISNSSVIDRRMLNYVYFDSGACECPKSVQERRKKIYQDEMGEDFLHLSKYYQEHLAEVNTVVALSNDDFLNDSAFLRTAEHILDKKIFTGCTDFTKAFIQIALDKGYSAENMKIVFLMEKDAYIQSCEGRIGKPALPWSRGGHHVVALKIGTNWKIMNTTSEYPEFYSSGLKLPDRLTELNFKQVPMNLIYAGSFNVENFLSPFTFQIVKNIYVSGQPNSIICQ